MRTWRLTCVCRTALYESLRTCSPAVTCSILPYRACVKLTGTRGAGVKLHFCASCSTEHFVSYSSPSTWNYSLNTTTKQRRFAFGCTRTSLVKRDYTVRRHFRYRTWRRTTPTSCQACLVVKGSKPSLPSVTLVHRQRRVLSSAPAGRAHHSTGSHCYDVTDGLRRGNSFWHRSAADSRTVVLACYISFAATAVMF